MVEKKNDPIAMEQRVEGLEDPARMVDFFIFPFLLFLSSKVEKPSPVPSVMLWLQEEFCFESNKDRKRFLRDLHEKLKKTLPMDLYAVCTLPEVVEAEPDFTIFDK